MRVNYNLNPKFASENYRKAERGENSMGNHITQRLTREANREFSSRLRFEDEAINRRGITHCTQDVTRREYDRAMLEAQDKIISEMRTRYHNFTCV